MDLLDTGDDAQPGRARRAGVAALVVVAVAAALWSAVALEERRRPAQAPPALRLSVDGFATGSSTAEVDYTVTNVGRRAVRLLGIAFEDDAALVMSVRLPDDELGAGESAGAGVRVRFACSDASTRPLRPELRLTLLTGDGERHVVAPGPGSDLSLDVGGGSLLTGPVRAPCSACVDVLDALAPVDPQAHEADRRAAARAAAAGTSVVVPGVVDHAQRTIRGVQDELPADQRALVARARAALADIASDDGTGDGTAARAFAVLDRAREGLDDLCDPAVPEVLR